MNNFTNRTITGISFVALIVASVIVSPYLFMIVFCVITMIALDELYTLLKTQDKDNTKVLWIVIGTLMFLCFALSANDVIEIKYLLLNIPLVLIIFLTELFKSHRDSIMNIGRSLLGLFYIVLPFSILNYFYQYEIYDSGKRYSLLLGFFILVWMYDVAAYVFGSLLGRHKMFERVSPKKTWEGAVGGAIICLISGYLLSLIFIEINGFKWLMISVIIIVFGTLGDLFESMLKRSAGVKDSGRILPGHGGILDRFDAVLFAAPAVFVYLSI